MKSKTGSTDIHTLMAAEEAAHRPCHYLVEFEVILDEPEMMPADLPGEDLDEPVAEEIVVAAGYDAQEAIDKVREYVLDPEEFGLKVKRFLLIGVAMLSEAIL